MFVRPGWLRASGRSTSSAWSGRPPSNNARAFAAPASGDSALSAATGAGTASRRKAAAASARQRRSRVVVIRECLPGEKGTGTVDYIRVDSAGTGLSPIRNPAYCSGNRPSCDSRTGRKFHAPGVTESRRRLHVRFTPPRQHPQLETRRFRLVPAAQAYAVEREKWSTSISSQAPCRSATSLRISSSTMNVWPKTVLQMCSRRMGATVAWVDRPSDGRWPLRVQAFFASRVGNRGGRCGERIAAQARSRGGSGLRRRADYDALC